MVTFRNNNNRRNNFRRNDRNFKSIMTEVNLPQFSNNENFQRKIPNRNNHNASKLIEKYNNLAREALSVGDKILSENYFQHADHFTRIQSEQENIRKSKHSDNNLKDTKVVENTENKTGVEENNKKDSSKVHSEVN